MPFPSSSSFFFFSCSGAGGPFPARTKPLRCRLKDFLMPPPLTSSSPSSPFLSFNFLSKLSKCESGKEDRKREEARRRRRESSGISLHSHQTKFSWFRTRVVLGVPLWFVVRTFNFLTIDFKHDENLTPLLYENINIAVT